MTPGVNLKIDSLGEIFTKIENMLTNKSVAQLGSNYEKKLEVKTLVGLPFKMRA